ncbi:hypothetical protein QMK61_16500 [Fulvimonas sp. R45]|uniref:hypothetical protein n=1 Tax=Fulvimonas sp. R45 TaxID=3045937 RepID=UPI00265F9408|nr:hypothetical protein [Fulvimonas sp. R45]MDO1530439.1 hypothetical protein [Fulvimonas sp. R45]
MTTNIPPIMLLSHNLGRTWRRELSRAIPSPSPFPPPSIHADQSRGKITNGELTGTFSGNAQTVHLKRKASYWQ